MYHNKLKCIKKNVKASKPDNFIGLVLKKKIRVICWIDITKLTQNLLNCEQIDVLNNYQKLKESKILLSRKLCAESFFLSDSGSMR